MRFLAVILPLLFLSTAIPGHASSLAPAAPEPSTPPELPLSHPAMSLSLPIKSANEVTFNTTLSLEYSSFDAGLGGVVTSNVVNSQETKTAKLDSGETVHVAQDLGYVGFKTGISLVSTQNGGFSFDYRYLIAKNVPTSGNWQDDFATAGYSPDPVYFDTVNVQGFSANWNLDSGHDFDIRILLPNISNNTRLVFAPFITLFASYYDQSFYAEYQAAGGAEPWNYHVAHRQYTEAMGPGLGLNLFYSLLTKPRQVMGFRANLAYNPLSVHYNIAKAYWQENPNLKEKGLIKTGDNTDNCTRTKGCIRTLVEFGYAHTPPAENTYTYTGIGIDTALYLGFQEAFGTAFGIYSPQKLHP